MISHFDVSYQIPIRNDGEKDSTYDGGTILLRYMGYGIGTVLQAVSTPGRMIT